MTKYEKKIKSMLNYYEINLGGSKDEKMTKSQRNNFLDTFNKNYDAYIMEDIISKITDKFKKDKDPENLDESDSDDGFFDLPEDGKNDKSHLFPLDPNVNSGRRVGNSGSSGVNPEIEMFVSWLRNLLYTADHKVIVDQNKEGTITNITVEKVKKGGKKK